MLENIDEYYNEGKTRSTREYYKKVDQHFRQRCEILCETRQVHINEYESVIYLVKNATMRTDDGHNIKLVQAENMEAMKVWFIY